MTTKTAERREAPQLKRDAQGRERRLLKAQDVELRTDDDGNRQFVGHAAVFDSPTLIRGWFEDWKEQIAPGAFRKTISEADVRMLVNHDPNLLLARNNAGTLKLSEDDVGLLSEADIDPRQTYASDVIISLDRGDISQMSFAFEVVREEWDFEQEPILRTIQEVKLYDVSIVTYPAYADTDASLRSAGFDVLCRLMGFGDEERKALLQQAAAIEEIDPGFRPVLRAGAQHLQAVTMADDAVDEVKEAWRAKRQAFDFSLDEKYAVPPQYRR